MARAKIFHLTIDEDLCKGCRICVEFCPTEVFEVSSDINARGYYVPAVTNIQNCTGCRFCELLCPDMAIVLQTEGEEAIDS